MNSSVTSLRTVIGGSIGQNWFQVRWNVASSTGASNAQAMLSSEVQRDQPREIAAARAASAGPPTRSTA